MGAVRPRLGVYWEDAAFSPLEIAEAAGELCDIVWIIGWSSPPITFHLKVLRRLVNLLDVRGNQSPKLSRRAPYST
jgi:hypothetical protein